MRKVVLDTNILVSALWSKQGNPFRIVEMFFSGEIVLYYTTEMIEEYEEVLCREKFGFPKGQVKSLLDELKKNGVLGESVDTGPEVFVDETDRKFYNAAKTYDATLITGNIKHYPDKPFILTPNDFLQAFGTQER